ncbi:transposase [Micromonospora sp. KC207]|uniref:transposase n=1 Tax=Micromonospora sp. KC207 TaxID=2530377 RepID=UPI001FB72F58|nr:transposase [Micromonospora sp. KC207]
MAGGKTVAAQRDAWICFEDEAGQTLRPPKARTWGRRGRTPVIPVSGKGSGRVSIAGLSCYQPGRRSRFIYRTIVHRRRKGERRSFSERDYISLLNTAHQQLGRPARGHLGQPQCAHQRRDATDDHRPGLATRHPATRLPPDLNPVEAVWSHLKRSIGNLAINGVEHLQAIIKNRLKSIQYRTDLLDSFLTTPA